MWDTLYFSHPGPGQLNCGYLHFIYSTCTKVWMLQRRQVQCAVPVGSLASVDQISFSDHKTVFQYKSTVDLLRNLSILRYRFIYPL